MLTVEEKIECMIKAMQAALEDREFSMAESIAKVINSRLDRLVVSK